jgi:hypothetical protein
VCVPHNGEAHWPIIPWDRSWQAETQCLQHMCATVLLVTVMPCSGCP